MRAILVSTLFMIISMSVFAQKGDAMYTTYLDATFNETVKRKAVYIRQMDQVNDTLLNAEIRTVEDNVLKMTGQFLLRNTELLEHGHFVFFYPSGQIESEGMYELGYKMGSWKRFTAAGQQRPDRFYNPDRGEILRAVEGK